MSEACRWYGANELFDAPCPKCQHLAMLHTRGPRGCAACEAIASAIAEARKATTNDKPSGPP
jgi:hypothetical protein